MRIFILNWRDPKNPKSGGAEAVTMKHAFFWVKNGHEVIWFTSSFKNARKSETIDGVKIIRKGSYLTVFLFAPFYYFFSKNKFDIIVDEIHGIPFFTPFYVRKPKIAFIHEIAREIWDYMFPFPINFFGKIIEPFYLAVYRDQYFWVPAKSARDELMKLGVSGKKIHIIPCGIEKKPQKNILAKAENDPIFIFVSRVVKMKGVEDIIQSFRNIVRVFPGAKLWIVGNGDSSYIFFLKKIVAKYSLSKNVIFFGFVSEKKKMELLKKANILLHASVKEGWGLVVIEAASQSTPSVVYNVSGLRDSVKNGVTGIVLSANTPEVMAKEAIDLIRNKEKYKSMQRNCLTWASSLRWEKFTKQSLELLEIVAHDKKH